MRSKFNPRFISAAVLGLFTVFLIVMLPLWAFMGYLCLLIGASLNEFYLFLRNKGIAVYRPLGMLIGLAIPVATFFQYRSFGDWQITFIPLICLFIFVVQFMRRNNNSVMIISAILFASLYISWFLSFILKVRFLPSGELLVLYLVLVVKSSDIGAYVIGSRWGKRRLISRISPKKTLEGLLGGLALGAAASLASGLYLPGWSPLQLLIVGVLLGIVAQVGDLSESLIKRDCRIKDSSQIIPGMGGVLDVMDSFLFTAPLFYFYLKTIL